MAWQAGKTVNKNRYIIQEVLGEGRFGITYFAVGRHNNQLVVIKTPIEAGFNPFWNRFK